MAGHGGDTGGSGCPDSRVQEPSFLVGGGCGFPLGDLTYFQVTSGKARLPGSPRQDKAIVKWMMLNEDNEQAIRSPEGGQEVASLPRSCLALGLTAQKLAKADQASRCIVTAWLNSSQNKAGSNAMRPVRPLLPMITRIMDSCPEPRWDLQSKRSNWTIRTESNQIHGRWGSVLEAGIAGHPSMYKHNSMH